MRQIVLPHKKHLLAEKSDAYVQLELESSAKTHITGKATEMLDLSELSNSERQASHLYQIYGKINIISQLNASPYNYTKVEQLFTQNTQSRDFNRTFKPYLLIPDENSAYVIPDYPLDPFEPLREATLTSDRSMLEKHYTNYMLNLKVIGTPADITIAKSGFERNLFGDVVWSFTLNYTLNMEGMRNFFGHQGEKVYLMFLYDPQDGENVQWVTPQDSGLTGWSWYKVQEGFNYGDIIPYAKVHYTHNQFKEQIIDTCRHHVSSRPFDTMGSISFNYDPFVPIDVIAYEDEILQLSTSSEDWSAVPDWAKEHGGYFYWSEIEEFGMGNKLDYPFSSGAHYIFKHINLIFKANMDDVATKAFYDLYANGITKKSHHKTNNEDLFKQC